LLFSLEFAILSTGEASADGGMLTEVLDVGVSSAILEFCFRDKREKDRWYSGKKLVLIKMTT